MAVTTIADLLALLLRDPGRPRVTWYGDDGERVELSGAVLVNWVNKTSNLLVEEFDAGPGTRVLLDLPGHWRTVVWALAAWRVGATGVLTGAGTTPAAEVVVTARPDDHVGSASQLVAVSLPALARRYPGALPAGSVDAASAVMTYGDVIGWAPPTDPRAAAVESPGGSTPHAELVAPSTGAPAARALVTAGRDAVAAVELTTTLDLLATDGSVVLVDATLADRLASDPDRRDRLTSSERVTVSLG